MTAFWNESSGGKVACVVVAALAVYVIIRGEIEIRRSR